jgi:PiT family inorganic phosphate transporter
MPSSSTHALVGGLIGASLAAANGNWNVLIWSREKVAAGKVSMEGIYHKVVIPMIGSPMMGITIGFLVMGLIFAVLSHWKPRITCPLTGLLGGLIGWLLPSWVLLFASWVLHFVAPLQTLSEKISHLNVPFFVHGLFCLLGFLALTSLCWRMGSWTPSKINSFFSKLQIFSAGYMGFGHGMADAQKTMGVIMLTLYGATASGDLDNLPSWLGFLKIADKSASIPMWIIITCALTMAAGTYAGGWRIIKTLGHKMVKMKPVHGFAAETTAATILATTGALGMPVSTTHTITTSIMGVGAAKRSNAIQWSLVEQIVWAWVMTIPATGILGWVIYKFCGLFT